MIANADSCSPVERKVSVDQERSSDVFVYTITKDDDENSLIPYPQHMFPRLPLPLSDYSDIHTPFRVHSSFVAQADGWMYKLLRLRISHDLFGTLADSYCKSYGTLSRAWASEVLLVNGCFDTIPESITKAANEKCVCVCVVPVPAGVGYAWYDLLRLHAAEVIPLVFGPNFFGRGEAILGKGNSSIPSRPRGFEIIIADFRLGKAPPSPKRTPRFSFSRLDMNVMYDSSSLPKLDPLPFFITRILSLPESLDRKCDDSVKSCPPLERSNLLPIRPEVPVQFNLPAVQAAALEYPDAFTGAYVHRGSERGYGSFSGDRSKHVLIPNMPSFSHCANIIREGCMKDVSIGRNLGPFGAPPFPNKWCDSQPRNVPLGAVPKHKWSPEDGAKRPIGNCSAGDSSSINALQDDPSFLQVHRSYSDVVQIGKFFGTGTAWVAADVVGAHRLNAIDVDNLHLHCKLVVTESFGEEWFVERCNPFGLINSFWSWEALASVIDWQLLKKGLRLLFRYVDNFYAAIPPLRDGSVNYALIRVVSRIFDEVMSSLGIPLHERQVGCSSNLLCLGWITNNKDQVSVCVPERVKLMTDLLKSWTGKNVCSLQSLMSLIGLLYFVGECFCIGRADLRPLYDLRTHGSEKAARRNVDRSKVFLDIPPHVKSVISFWNAYFPLWDGCAPFTVEPGPCCIWDTIIRTDASPLWGAGGTRSDNFYFCIEWSQEERSNAMRVSNVSAPFFEALCFLFAMRIWAFALRGKTVLWETDCKPVQLAVLKGYSPSDPLQAVIFEIRMLLAFYHIRLHPSQVDRRFVEVEDLLSRSSVIKAFRVWKGRRGLGSWDRKKAVRGTRGDFRARPWRLG